MGNGLVKRLGNARPAGHRLQLTTAEWPTSLGIEPKTMERYRHNQTAGWPLTAGLGLAAAATAIGWIAQGVLLCLVLAAVFALLLALFYRLETRVEDTHLRLRFGVGIVSLSFPLSDIRSCQPVENKWYHGWGIHLTPNGWLYNIRGLSAVELAFSDGHLCRVGTDDPAGLCRAIVAVIGHEQ